MGVVGSGNIDVSDADAPVVQRKAHPFISIVAPCFNEEESIDIFHREISKELAKTGGAYEIVLVDDGSTDNTRKIMAAYSRRDPAVKSVVLSRNFGKEAALTAGLAHARGDVVVVMDVDLQDPPELIHAFLERWREGYDVVYGERTDRHHDTFMKRFTAGQFYRTFNQITRVDLPENTGDFRLMDRKVVDAIMQLPERSRFMKGLFAWVGFKSVAVPFQRPARAAGETKFNYWKLWNFALDGIISFSSAPLRIWAYVGGVTALFSFMFAAFIIVQTAVRGIDVPGYASLLTVMLFLGGVQLLSIGVIGEYLSRLFVETKQRPLYLVDEVYNDAADVEREQRQNDIEVALRSLARKSLQRDLG